MIPNHTRTEVELWHSRTRCPPKGGRYTSQNLMDAQRGVAAIKVASGAEARPSECNRDFALDAKLMKLHAGRKPSSLVLDWAAPMSPTNKSSLEAGTGCLYLVATPIGNLEDITLRALRILKEVDLIACEDTRQTQKLLQHYEMQKSLVSYHEHNELTRAPELVIELEQGAKVALVSDAGTPGISDPGHRLVALCLRHRIPVVPIPGPSALVAALAASGLPTDEFLFVGFLPSRAAARRKALEMLKAEPRTLVLYEAPHRITDALADAAEILGPRPAVLAREVTKVHEEFRRGHLGELLESAQKRAPRGEITLLIAPGPAEPAPVDSHTSLRQRVEQLESESGMDHKAALKQAARERGLGKREAYKQLLQER